VTLDAQKQQVFAPAFLRTWENTKIPSVLLSKIKIGGIEDIEVNRRSTMSI